MKIYFGKLDDNIAQEMLADGGTLFEKDSEYFEFCIETNEDVFRIKDSIGRMVPFALEDARALADAVLAIESASNAVENYNTVITNLNDDSLIRSIK